MDFAVPANHRVKIKESEKVIAIVVGANGTVPQNLESRLEILKIKGSIAEIGQNTEKTGEDLLSLRL